MPYTAWAPGPNIEGAQAPCPHEVGAYAPQADSVVVIGVVSSSLAWLSLEAHTLQQTHFSDWNVSAVTVQHNSSSDLLASVHRIYAWLPSDSGCTCTAHCVAVHLLQWRRSASNFGATGYSHLSYLPPLFPFLSSPFFLPPVFMVRGPGGELELLQQVRAQPNCQTKFGAFSTLHGMPARTGDEKAVRLSVCLSVHSSICPSNAWIVTKWKKDLSRFLNHTKDHLAYFSEKKNGWLGATPSTWYFGSTGPHCCEIFDFQPIFSRNI